MESMCSRAFTVPAASEQRPAKEWPAILSSPERPNEETASDWAERAVVYTNDVLVEDSKQEPRSSERHPRSPAATAK